MIEPPVFSPEVLAWLERWPSEVSEAINKWAAVQAESLKPELEKIDRELRSLANTPEFKRYLSGYRQDKRRRKTEARKRRRATWKKRGHR